MDFKPFVPKALLLKCSKMFLSLRAPRHVEEDFVLETSEGGMLSISFLIPSWGHFSPGQEEVGLGHRMNPKDLSFCLPLPVIKRVIF